MEDKLSIEEAHRLIQEAWDRGDPPPLEYFVSKLCKSKRKRQRKKWVAQRFVRVLGQFSKFSQKN
jgi:fatty acid desaturase